MNKSVFRAQLELCAVNKVWSSTLNNEKKKVFAISAHFKKFSPYCTLNEAVVL